MLDRILRQYRRLGFGMLMFSIFMGAYAVFVGWPGTDNFPQDSIAIISMTLAVLITAFLIVGAAIVVLGIIAPGSLPLIEIVSIALFVGTPLVALRKTLGLSSHFDLIVILGALILVERLIVGDWGAKIRRRDVAPKTTRFTVPLSPEEVWKKVVPLPGHGASYFRPSTDFLAAPDGSDADFVMHSKRRWGLKDSVEQVYVEANDPCTHFRFRSEASLGSAMPGERVDIRLAPGTDGTTMDLTVAFLNVSLGMRLRLWLGQDARDYAKSVRNRLLGRRDGTIHGSQIAA